MKLKLFYSTCPNDVFMFTPLTEGWIDTEGLEFETELYDIEELNKFIMNCVPDVGKFSYAVLPEIIEKYFLLDSGSALGKGVGPLLIANQAYGKEELGKIRIAIPGKFTTAHLLLKFYLPELKETKEYLFSEILPAVSEGKEKAGVIIHEGRFVYKEYGVKCLADLGEHWEKQTGLPIPLGGIAIKRKYGEKIKEVFEELLRRSIEYAWEHKEKVYPFLKENAQELSEEVIWEHVKTYVNDYSLSLGKEGKKAISRLTGINF